MEGPTIVRPDRGGEHPPCWRCHPFNGGPDNRPARLSAARSNTLRSFPLQWRAGQSSGQTDPEDYDYDAWLAPSMEGRTIVRPDLSRMQRIHRCLVGPSMEGRTIVRPDQQRSRQRQRRQSAFNGGPDNRPARLAMHALKRSLNSIPSMEGRTIVRPDLDSFRATNISGPAFNGGPDNRPARRGNPGLWSESVHVLQWRAGQSSGQTSRQVTVQAYGTIPSMEGWTIVRPDANGAMPGREVTHSVDGVFRKEGLGQFVQVKPSK